MPNFISQYTGLQIEDKLTKAGTAVQPEGLTKAAVGLGNADNTADIDKPISAATQTALDAKEGTITAGTTSQYFRGDKTWRDLFTDVRAATLTGLSTATNAVITATDTVLSALGKLQKQVSDNLTTLTNHTGSTSNPHSVTKAQVGLSNVDNTADADKPVSTATQSALNLKLNAANGTASGLTLNDGYTEEVFAVSGTAPALSPTNGSIQTWTLTGNSTPTLGTWGSGQSMTLLIDDGTAYVINWVSMGIVWKTGGGTAPVLLTTGYTSLSLVKVGTTVYGWLAGNA